MEGIHRNKPSEFYLQHLRLYFSASLINKDIDYRLTQIRHMPVMVLQHHTCFANIHPLKEIALIENERLV